MHERTALERGLRISHDWKRFVLDHDVLDGVHHRVPVLAEHYGDRIPNVLDRVTGDRPVLGVLDLDARGHPGHRQRTAEIGHVGAGEHRNHAFSLLRR